jgi:hypothetical protein
VVGLLDERNHLDGRERRLPPALVVERADPHEPVGAGLDRQVAERIRHLDLEGGRLEPGLLGIGGVQDRGRVVVPLGPAQVHPQQHLGEVGRVHAPGARADRHNGLAGIPLAIEQGADFELADVLLEGGEFTLGFSEGVGVLLLGAHLDEHLKVLDPAVHPGDPVALAVGPRERGGHLLSVVGVVPEVGDGGFGFQPLDLGRQGIEVGHLAHGIHRRAQVLDLFSEVDSHEGQAYASAPVCRSARTRPPPGVRRVAAGRGAGGIPAHTAYQWSGDMSRCERGRSVRRRPTVCGVRGGAGLR